MSMHHSPQPVDVPTLPRSDLKLALSKLRSSSCSAAASAASLLPLPPSDPYQQGISQRFGPGGYTRLKFNGYKEAIETCRELAANSIATVLALNLLAASLACAFIASACRFSLLRIPWHTIKAAHHRTPCKPKQPRYYEFCMDSRPTSMSHGSCIFPSESVCHCFSGPRVPQHPSIPCPAWHHHRQLMKYCL